MDESPTTKMEIDVGHAQKSFCAGDFLNALDQLAAYFSVKRGAEARLIAKALRLYADIEEGLE